MHTFTFTYRGQHLFECRARDEASAWAKLKAKFSTPSLGWSAVSVRCS